MISKFWFFGSHNFCLDVPVFRSILWLTYICDLISNKYSSTKSWRDCFLLFLHFCVFVFFVSFAFFCIFVFLYFFVLIFVLLYFVIVLIAGAQVCIFVLLYFVNVLIAGAQVFFFFFCSFVFLYFCTLSLC